MKVSNRSAILATCTAYVNKIRWHNITIIVLSAIEILGFMGAEGGLIYFFTTFPAFFYAWAANEELNGQKITNFDVGKYSYGLILIAASLGSIGEMARETIVILGGRPIANQFILPNLCDKLLRERTILCKDTKPIAKLTGYKWYLNLIWRCFKSVYGTIIVALIFHILGLSKIGRLENLSSYWGKILEKGSTLIGN
ncbi:hypothetical protein, no similarity [Maudiozyma saulgeensis]|uniref:Uncharacterized protein n=1 Tax=Maudiozyma saulgeensis TaxID=1789683 RepID=A0A1X7RA37_9SACH|nr:hypothetical protein, no similarity [Kazachstania saulgeensis]